MTTPECRIELMGTLRVVRSGQAQGHFRTYKTGALLAYLAACCDRPARREELIELLWPDNPPASGLNGLRITLTALRRVFAVPPLASCPAPSPVSLAGAASRSDIAIVDTPAASPLSIAPPFNAVSSVLMADNKHVWLDPGAYTTDKADFEMCLKEAARAANDVVRAEWLKRALSLYGGDLLPGYDEPKIVSERIRLADARHLALRRLVGLLVQSRDVEGALDYAHRAVEADPLREESQRMLIQLYAGLGHQDAARRQYHALERLLAEQMQSRPSAALRDLMARLDGENGASSVSSQATTATLPSDASLSNIAPASPPPPRFAPPAALRLGSLPTPYSPFFGREDSLAYVLEMIDTPHTRLITLTGLGGSGKTRLALQVGARLRDDLQGAVWFVPLAHVSDPGRILDAIAETVVPARHSPMSSFDQIVHALASANALLILDNFEHLAEQGAATIPPLLDALPGLICLITSRHRLNLSGEYEYAVLPLPTPQSAGTPERLLEFASVQLFVDRARAVRSEFALTRENAPAIAALCHHLEGVPLAIELAAAYAQMLTPTQILARAARRLPLLISRSKDTPARHASLRAALDWSWQLLDPAQQRFFARLSVLRGGWTLEAAQAIAPDSLRLPSYAPAPPAPAFCTPAPPASGLFSPAAGFDAAPDLNASAPARAFRHADADPFAAFLNDGDFAAPPDAAPFPETDAFQTLTELRERSLIRAEEAGPEMRYQMLETLREFAGEQMDAPAEVEARQRHSRYYLDMAESAEALLTGPDAGAWLKRLHTDRANLRAALHFLLDSPAAIVCVESAGDEGANGRETTWDGLRMAGALWRFWYVRGYYDEGQEWLQKALGLPAAQTAPVPIRLKAWRGLGNLALAQGHLDRAHRAFEEHRTLAERAGSVTDRAAARGSLAHVLRERGHLEQARALREESLCLFRQAGDEHGIALTLANLAVVMTAQGEHAAALGMHRECLQLFRQLGDTQNVVLALNNLAFALLEGGRKDEARDCLTESLTLAYALEDRGKYVLALNTLVALASQANAPRQAAILLGCIGALLPQMNLPAESALHTDFRREFDKVRVLLGEREFEQRVANAQACSLEQILDIISSLPV